MQSSVFRKVERDFNVKRQHAQSDARNFKKNVYDENPILEEIESKINMIALKSAKSRIFSDDLSRQVEQEKLEVKLEKLNREYNNCIELNIKDTYYNMLEVIKKEDDLIKRTISSISKNIQSA